MSNALARKIGEDNGHLTKSINNDNKTLALNIRNENEKLALQLKNSDYIMECNRRYDDLSKSLDRLHSEIRNGIAPSVEIVMTYYRRYWNLQSEQFLLYQKSYIPEDIYRQWIAERKNSFDRNDGIICEIKTHIGTSISTKEVEITYKDAWKELKPEFENIDSDFVSFITLVEGTKEGPSSAFGRYPPR